MANWNGLQLTNKGIALQAKVQAGEELVITKLKLGSGVVSGGTDIKTLNDLIEPEQNLGIGAKEAVEDYCKISSTITNTELEAGYYVRELGVFAQDPDVGEILYMYTTDGAPDYLPAGGGSTAISQEFSVMIAVNDTDNVSVVINDDALATMGYVQLQIQQHNSDAEAHELIGYLERELGNDFVHLFPGVSYRHLLKIKGGNKNLRCTPPHDVPGTPFRNVMVKATKPEAEDTAKLINNLILKSQELLAKHPVNIKRMAEGKDPANSIWPWSPGYRPAMETLQQKYGIGRGAVISAVDLIRGIGVYAGLEPIIVDGATGLYDTNYEGKARAAIDALRGDYDFVFLHVEASDEAGHEGDYELKVKTIEYLDHRICQPIIDATLQMDEPVTIALLPDHPTPCRLRTHSSAPVPFAIFRPGERPDRVPRYDEEVTRYGMYGTMSRDEFIKALFMK